MNLEEFMPRETWKTKVREMPCNPAGVRQIQSDSQRKVERWLPDAGGSRQEWSLAGNRYRGSVLWDERLVEADGIVAVVQHHKSAQDLCTQETKMSNFVLYIFHGNKIR